jgi:hypothetical protein
MPTYADFERDYWAPDRDEVLRRMRPQQAPQPYQQTVDTPEWSMPGSAPTNTGFTGNMGQPAPIQYQPPAQPSQPATAAPAPTPAPFDRTAFRDAWMSTGSDRGRQDALLQQYGLTLDPAGRATLPTGEIIDLRYGAKAGGTQATWTGAGGTQNGVPVNSGAPSTTAPGSFIGSSATLTNGVPAGISGELYRLLLDRARQGTAIDRSNPNVRAQADAFSAQQERAQRNYLADLAESSGPLANLRGEQRMAAERAGQASGAFEAQLMGREIEARRQEIQAALTELRGMLTADQQMALQRELASLNDATARLGIQTQAATAQGNRDLQWQQALLQNSQFMQNLGLQAEDRASYWDAVRSGLLD